MSYFVYILYSEQIDRFYIGYTANLEDRIYRHRNSGSKSTKKATDWKLVYKESFGSRSQAMRREAEIKAKKSRQYIQKLILSTG